MSDHTQLPPIFVSVAETMRLLGRGKTGVFDLIREGQIESVMLGGSRRIRYSSVVAFADRLVAEQSKPKVAA